MNFRLAESSASGTETVFPLASLKENGLADEVARSLVTCSVACGATGRFRTGSKVNRGAA